MPPHRSAVLSPRVTLSGLKFSSCLFWISTVRDYKTAASQNAVKLAEHRADRAENLLFEESQAQKTTSVGEITETIKEIIVNSALNSQYKKPAR